jgi:Phosphopantetheine attachment site
MVEQILVRREQLPLPCRYVAPRSPTEALLAQIWSTALCMDCVGVDDRYHDLGGDSLLATMIFGQIAESFRVVVPMALLAEAATVAELAPKIDALVQAGAGARAKD